jgi:uncharacterized protein CbrC (UPF0167 family)
MTDSFPTFVYHPDPVATGSVSASDATCVCCRRARGFIYTGPVYAAEELDSVLCPWCIADGSAATKFHAEFVDEDAVGGYGEWAAVSPEIAAVVSRRTPGFSGWQQERWWTHCDDAAAFLGPAGAREVQGAWAGAIPSLRADVGYDDDEWADYVAALDKDRGPTAYIFRCRHCGALGGYSDIH